MKIRLLLYSTMMIMRWRSEHLTEVIVMLSVKNQFLSKQKLLEAEEGPLRAISVLDYLISPTLWVRPSPYASLRLGTFLGDISDFPTY